jgi:hypothetical protein
VRTHLLGNERSSSQFAGETLCSTQRLFERDPVDAFRLGTSDVDFFETEPVLGRLCEALDFDMFWRGAVSENRRDDALLDVGEIDLLLPFPFAPVDRPRRFGDALDAGSTHEASTFSFFTDSPGLVFSSSPLLGGDSER